MLEKEIICPVCHNKYKLNLYFGSIYGFWTIRARCETCKYDLKLLTPIIIGTLLLIIPLIIGYLLLTYLFLIDFRYSFIISLIIAVLLHIAYLFSSINFINEQKLNNKILSFYQ